ncbi:hypothetical protein RvY_01229-2 [Ramazzottius varieornatus]|uniref:Uncharacterized protein n=1 Tax=Ramazzottius varieornatus TaxID=947166 RepID=A0A1D1UFX8_RAMVA|nr:hypothetical protein RvY_01229-2 [Ramazzottius varieornatus]
MTHVFKCIFLLLFTYCFVSTNTMDLRKYFSRRTTSVTAVLTTDSWTTTTEANSLLPEPGGLIVDLVDDPGTSRLRYCSASN